MDGRLTGIHCCTARRFVLLLTLHPLLSIMADALAGSSALPDHRLPLHHRVLIRDDNSAEDEPLHSTAPKQQGATQGVGRGRGEEGDTLAVENRDEELNDAVVEAVKTMRRDLDGG